MDIDALNNPRTGERNREAEGFAAIMYLISALHHVVPDEYIKFIKDFMKSKHKEYFQNINSAEDFLDLCDPSDKTFLKSLAKNYGNLRETTILNEYQVFKILGSLLQQEMEAREIIKNKDIKSDKGFSSLYDQDENPIEIVIDSDNKLYVITDDNQRIELAETTSYIDSSYIDSTLNELSRKIENTIKVIDYPVQKLFTVNPYTGMFTVNPYTGMLDDLSQRMNLANAVNMKKN